MTLPVKFFESAMPGAPVLTGQQGSLVNVLDAVLVNGFNSLSVSSITLSGGVATATFATAHGYTVGYTKPLTLLFAGADQAEYNGDQVVTVTSTTQVTFPVTGSPATPATGTITAKVSPLGWTKAFAGTNIASYKMPAGSSGIYLGVDDNQASGAQYYARVRGFETMSAAGVAAASGTGLFPTDAQISGGVWWNKSITQDSTARTWRIGGDANFCWLSIIVNNVTGALYWFGDPISLKSGDAYPTTLLGNATGSISNYASPASLFSSNPTATATPGLYFARNSAQLGGAIQGSLIGDYSVSSGWGSGGFSYPNPADNGCELSLVRLGEPSLQGLRAVLPGLYQPLHAKPQSDGDLLTDIVGLSGRTALFMSGASANSDLYRYVADLTGPWR